MENAFQIYEGLKILERLSNSYKREQISELCKKILVKPFYIGQYDFVLEIWHLC